jgi:UDP-N-acetylmuramyl-tripeptide synthetase
MGEKAGVIGTLGFGTPENLQFHSGLTTPDPINLQRTLYRMKSQGFKWVCIEASSIGLEQGRLNHVRIELAAYTNFSRDHLDYHKSMEEYEQAKLILARWPGLKHAVVNADDPTAESFGLIAQTCGARLLRVGRQSMLDACIQSLAHGPTGLSVEVKCKQAGQVKLDAPVVGDFNADNLTLSFTSLIALGFDPVEVAKALSQVSPAPGRMQKVSDHPCVVVDYAHTSDALEKALNALRPVAEASQGLLWVLFGCGGDRDKGKRPLMAQVSEQLADWLVITSDNPRSEDPASIVKDMLAGLKNPHSANVHVELDRKKAIEWCLEKAADQDVVLLAGKGHETTQTMGSQVLEHSDVDYSRYVLREVRHA